MSLPRPAALIAILALSSPPVQAQRPVTPARAAAWIPFRWQGDTLGGHWQPRAVLLVPVRLAGHPGTYYLQLDTGAGWPRWYEVPFRQVSPKSFGRVGRDTAPDLLTLRGYVGTVSIANDTFLVEKSFGDSLPVRANAPRVVGTLGLRFFRHRVLVLDFPHQRFAMVGPDDALPPTAATGVSYVPARYENGYLFVPLHVAGHAVNDFFFDTGASSFFLETTAANWRAFTGRNGSEPDNTRMSVWAWGKLVDDIGAPVAGSIELGPVHVTQPPIFFQREIPGAPDFFARNPGLAGGIIGNAMFSDSNVVIIDLSRRRFGVAVAGPR